MKLKKLTKNIALLSATLPFMFASHANAKVTTKYLGNQPTLVITTNFANAKMKFSNDYYYNMIFNGSKKSVSNYYRAISNGKISVTPVKETYGKYGKINDGIITVTLPTNHPNPKKNTEYNQTLQNSLNSALKAADKYVNFTSYDKNKDKMISPNELHVIFILAGYDSSADMTANPGVWAHRGLLYSSLTLDGVSFGTSEDSGYVAIGDLSYSNTVKSGGKTHTYLESEQMGTFAHEFGHDLGLPDLYDTDYSSQGIGPHSLMSSGNYGSLTNEAPGKTPVIMDAWSRIQIGIMKPSYVTKTGTYVLYNSSSTHPNVLYIPTKNKGEYFLLENREFSGYDAGLKNLGVVSGGVAIWHINENAFSNTNEKNPMIQLEEASQAKLGYSQLYKTTYAWGPFNHYYRYGYVNTFGPTTKPNSNLRSGSNSGITVVVKSRAANSMVVSVTVPKETPYYLQVPKNVTGFVASNITSNSATLKWNAVQGATGYTITRYDGYTEKVVYKGNALTFTDTNLPKNSYNIYMIKATNGYIDGDSSEVDVIIP